MMEKSSLNLLESLKELETEEIPEDFKTSTQWMKEWGLGKSQTNYYITLAIEKGKMEAKKFKVKRPTGFRQVFHYREL